MKLYVLVDNTLPLGYQAVQGGHALAEWLIDNKDDLKELNWCNDTLVYLQIDNVLEWFKIAKEANLNPSLFYEPDINAHTALACLSNGKLFKKLKLLGK